MMIARWTIDAKFGHKPEVARSMKQWFEDIGTQIGWTADKTRLMTGSIGAPESTLVAEVEVDSLGALNESFDKLSEIEAHQEWSRELQPKVVSGTNCWEVYRPV